MILKLSGINERTMVEIKVGPFVAYNGPAGWINLNRPWAMTIHKLESVEIEFGDLMEESVYRCLMENELAPVVQS